MPKKEPEYLDCWACGKKVTRYVTRGGVPRGKRRSRHKCPHGVECIAGTEDGATGFNGPPIAGKHHCAGCSARARTLQGAR